MSIILAKTARKYLLRDQDDVPIIRFGFITLPKKYIVIDTEIINKRALDILNITNEKIDSEETIMYLNSKLTNYLQERQRDYKVTGYLLDDFIVSKLELGSAITNFGRLNGMEYLIDLLHYHFYDSENKLYVTCEDPGTISFFHEVPGWKTLLLDFPVTYKDVTNTKKGEF